MPYTLLKFEKEEQASGTVYVALVKKDGEEQPFRVSIEHFTSVEEAKGEVERWIAVQDEDDARFAAEQERLQAEEKAEKLIDELNREL